MQTHPATPDITLANGRVVTHTRKPNGSQDATMSDGGPMSEAEGLEADDARAVIVRDADISRRIIEARDENYVTAVAAAHRVYQNAITAAVAAHRNTLAAHRKESAEDADIARAV